MSNCFMCKYLDYCSNGYPCNECWDYDLFEPKEELEDDKN